MMNNVFKSVVEFWSKLQAGSNPLPEAASILPTNAAQSALQDTGLYATKCILPYGLMRCISPKIGSGGLCSIRLS